MNLFYSIMNTYNQHLFAVNICYLSLSYWIIGFLSLYMMKYESRNGIVLSFSLWLCALIISFLLSLVLYDERFDYWIKKFDRLQFVCWSKVFFTKRFAIIARTRLTIAKKMMDEQKEKRSLCLLEFITNIYV